MLGSAACALRRSDHHRGHAICSYVRCVQPAFRDHRCSSHNSTDSYVLGRLSNYHKRKSSRRRILQMFGAATLLQRMVVMFKDYMDLPAGLCEQLNEDPDYRKASARGTGV